MRPTWADPNEDFFQLTERLYRLLDDSLRWEQAPLPAGSFSPATDILATDSEIVLLAEVPGMDRDQIAVQVDGHVVTISGERPAPEDEADALVRERSSGTFSRSFSLAYDLDPESVAARLEDGLLRVTIGRRKTKALDVM